MPTRTMTITEKRGGDNNSPHRSSLLLRSLVVTFGVCLIPRLYTVTFRPPSGLVSNLDNFVAAVTTTSCDKIHKSGRKNTRNTRKPAMATLTDTLGQRPTMTFGTFHTWPASAGPGLGQTMRQLTPKISSLTALAMTRHSEPARRAEIRRVLEADDRKPDTIFRPILPTCSARGT